MTPPPPPLRDGRTRIKVCGVTSVEIAQVAAEAGADFIGLVFAPDSPRYIADFQTAADILNTVSRNYENPYAVQPVGVFMNAFERYNSDLENWCNCEEWVQFHGAITDVQVEAYARTHTIVRGFHFDRDELAHWNTVEALDSLLIDGSEGGHGTAFDHAQLAELMPVIAKPVILAGGLTPENVDDAIRAVQPWGVDVSSGVESSRGVKEPSLIREFCQAVREADETLDAM